MKKINVNLILKNLSAVFCGIFYIALLLPFVSFKVDYSNSGYMMSDYEASRLNGSQLFTDGGIFGIVLLLMPLLILLATYLQQLAQYKKLICLIASIAMVFLVITCSFNIKSAEIGFGEGIEIKAHRLIGFWIMLACSIALTALSALSFFKDKEVADLISTGGTTDPDNPDSNLPQINIDGEKISNFAKNITNTISEQGKNISEKLSETVKSKGNNDSQPPLSESEYSNNNQNIPPQPHFQSQQANIPKGNPDEIMEQLKKLNELKESGVLTEEEFSAKKTELLQRF